MILIKSILAIVFVVSGALKSYDPLSFQSSILDYQVIGQRPSFFVASLLPSFEVFCGLALLVKTTALASSGAITGMLVVFLSLLIYTLFRGISVSCGCFGPLSESIPVAIVFDTALLGLSSYCFLHELRQRFVSSD